MEEKEEKPIIKGDKRIRGPDGKWIKGDPGGPGRPKGSVSIVTRVKQMLKEDPDLLQQIAEEFLSDRRLRQELIRQIDGSPRQQIEMEHKGSISLIQILNDAEKKRKEDEHENNKKENN